MQNRFKTKLAANMEYRLGIVSIPPITKKFIWTHTVFMLFTTIPGIFINTFFFRQNGSIWTVSIYNAISAFGSALTMHLSSQISLKKSPVYILRIGVFLFNIFYVSLLLLQDRAADYMILLGIINAVASGFYWQGYNELVKITTDDGIFDKVVSIIGLGSSVVNLIVPVMSGFVISKFVGRSGYTVIFGISLLFSIYTTYLTVRIGNIKIEGSSNLHGVYRYIFTNRNVLRIYISEIFRGIKNLSFPLFLSIIFFKFVTNEALLGVNTTLCGFISILSFIAEGRIIRQHNRLKSIFISTVFSILISLPLLFCINPVILFMLAMLNAAISAFLDNPAVGVFYNMLGSPKQGIAFSQLLSVREIFFAAGRVIGLVMLILFSGSDMMFAAFAIIVNGATFIMWFLLKKSYKNKRDVL